MKTPPTGLWGQVKIEPEAKQLAKYTCINMPWT